MSFVVSLCWQAKALFVCYVYGREFFVNCTLISSIAFTEFVCTWITKQWFQYHFATIIVIILGKPLLYKMYRIYLHNSLLICYICMTCPSYEVLLVANGFEAAFWLHSRCSFRKVSNVYRLDSAMVYGLQSKT